MTDTPAPEIARLQVLHPKATWRHEPAFPLQSIDLIASITNQVRDEPIHRPTVERYVAALETGDTFPPIVVREIPGPKGTTQHINLGGNHRTRAHIDAGRKTIDAWIVSCNDLAALEIAYHDNAHHGLPATEAEQIAHCLLLMDRGRSRMQAARTVGVDSARLYHHIDRNKAAKRAADLGLTQEFALIGVVIQARLVSVKDDRTFSKAIRTIAEEGMGQHASQQLITDVNAARDIAAAMDAIALHVRDWRTRARDRRGAKRGSSAHTTLSVNVRITQTLKPADVVEGARSPAERERLAELCLAGARHLKKIHDLARAVDR